MLRASHTRASCVHFSSLFSLRAASHACFLLTPPSTWHPVRQQSAQQLAALEAVEDSTIGALITTPFGNALASSSLLEIREIRGMSVGATVDVVAVGRVHIPNIESGRYYEARDVTNLMDDALPISVEAGTRSSSYALKLIRQGKLRDGRGVELSRLRLRLEQMELDERYEHMRDRLCSNDLDAPAHTCLARLYDLWGVENEAAAERHLRSFAAFERMMPVQRSLALGLRSTQEREHYASRCKLKTIKRASLESALDALVLPKP